MKELNNILSFSKDCVENVCKVIHSITKWLCMVFFNKYLTIYTLLEMKQKVSGADLLLGDYEHGILLWI